MTKEERLYKLFLEGLNSGDIDVSYDGDWKPSEDPPELEFGYWIAPKLKNKIDTLLGTDKDEEIKRLQNL